MPTEQSATAGDVVGGRRGTVGLVVAGVLAVLLLGIAVGFLFALPGPDGPARPNAVDTGFAQDMTVHHLQAVEMASWYRDHGEDPELRQLAFDIESLQRDQIGRMQGWLTMWQAASLPTGGHMAWMNGGGHEHGGVQGSGAVETMPGMATADELASLRSATGDELDVRFLQLMLRHHQGGLPMMGYGAQQAATPEVRHLAGQMVRTQQDESAYLRALLADRAAAPLPL